MKILESYVLSKLENNFLFFLPQPLFKITVVKLMDSPDISVFIRNHLKNSFPEFRQVLLDTTRTHLHEGSLPHTWHGVMGQGQNGVNVGRLFT